MNFSPILTHNSWSKDRLCLYDGSFSSQWCSKWLKIIKLGIGEMCIEAGVKVIEYGIEKLISITSPSRWRKIICGSNIACYNHSIIGDNWIYSHWYQKSGCRVVIKPRSQLRFLPISLEFWRYEGRDIRNSSKVT